MINSPIKQVTTTNEAAQMFGVKDNTVRAAILRGNLYAERSGNVWLIEIDAVKAYFGRDPIWVPERLKV